tara:strand:- start:506 stop:844 length:339 start_codon:yes stop_codon:yes gene_type:complete
MGILIRFKDTFSQCWSRVDLPNGDPIWISIARSSVKIKKSKLGITGAVLYKSKDLDKITKLGVQLLSSLNEFNTPVNLENFLLKVFTQLALESSTIEEFCSRILLAEKEAGI